MRDLYRDGLLAQGWPRWMAALETESLGWLVAELKMARENAYGLWKLVEINRRSRHAV